MGQKELLHLPFLGQQLMAYLPESGAHSGGLRAVVFPAGGRHGVAVAGKEGLHHAQHGGDIPVPEAEGRGLDEKGSIPAEPLLVAGAGREEQGRLFGRAGRAFQLLHEFLLLLPFLAGLCFILGGRRVQGLQSGLEGFVRIEGQQAFLLLFVHLGKRTQRRGGGRRRGKGGDGRSRGKGLLLLLGKAAAMLAELLVYLDGTQAGVLQSLMEVPRLEGEGQLFLGGVDRQEVLRDTQPEVVGASPQERGGCLE